MSTNDEIKPCINIDTYDVDEDHSIVDRFETVVDTYCNAIALDSDGQKTTYSELDRMANHISRYVLDQFLDTGPVALLFQNNLLSVASIFGVLKTGKMFVFLNPSFPSERLGSIIEAVKPVLILTEEKYLGMLSELCQLPIQNVSTFEFSSDINRPGVQVSPGAPAYIIYTSGSTGIPKGVVFTHRMVLHDNKYVIKDADISSTDRFGMLTSLSFVASRAGLYGALLAGATLCMHNLSNSDAETIAAWLDESQISILYTTPSLFRNIFSAVPDGHVFRFMRTVHLAGEKVTTSEVELFRSHCQKDGILIIVYGQTETGRVARFCIRHDMNWNGGIIPVGYPLPGKEVIIVGTDGQTVEPGEIGDIVVRSSYIPSGYIGAGGMGYMQDPVNSRVYLFNTGDTGRFTDDGKLVYLGRKDNQVKINGQRVELSEIEAALMQQKEIQSVLVMARPVGNDERQIRLIAYVVAKPADQITGKQLRERLSLILPAYMIPASFIFIPSMPLSAHGKVDLRSLPDPDHRRELTTADLPQDKVEKDLLAIWKRVLKLKTIGVLDDFFDLGGDSLTAMQLLLEIEKKFSQRMPLAVISKASNIREQGQILLNQEVMDFSSLLIPIHTDGTKEPIFCLGGRGGDPIKFNHLLRYLPTDRPVYFFRSRGLQPNEALPLTVEEIAADYLREIKRVQREGPYHFVGESGGGMVAYEIAQQLKALNEKTGLIVMLDTYFQELKEDKNLLVEKNPWILFRKHFQTLTQGSLREYIDYYKELRIFKEQARRERELTMRTRELSGTLNVYQNVESANMSAARLYDPKPFSGRVVMIRAKRQMNFDGGLLDHGWGKVGIEELIVHPVDCYHGNMLFEPFVQQVAEKINEYINAP